MCLFRLIVNDSHRKFLWASAFQGDWFHSVVIEVQVKPIWILQLSLREQQYDEYVSTSFSMKHFKVLS